MEVHNKIQFILWACTEIHTIILTLHLQNLSWVFFSLIGAWPLPAGGDYAWQMFDSWNPVGPLAEWSQVKSVQWCRCLGETGTKGHSLSDALPELLAPLAHQVCFYMHGMADSWLTSRALHCLELPTDALQSALAHRRLVATENVMNARVSRAGYTTTGFMCSLSSPLKATCHLVLVQTCPVEPNSKCTPSTSPSSSSSFSSCTHTCRTLSPFLRVTG